LIVLVFAVTGVALGAASCASSAAGGGPGGDPGACGADEVGTEVTVRFVNKTSADIFVQLGGARNCNFVAPFYITDATPQLQAASEILTRVG